MNKFYMIPNSKNLCNFNEELILPLKDYSVGFDVYFTSEEIESISKSRNVNVIINSFLHKDKIEQIKSEINKMPGVKFFFVEDLGLTNLIDRKRIVLFQNHIINNYKSINYINKLNIENIVVSNELTIDEIKTIRDNTSSNLFYFLINRNNLMYSKRKLISSYFDYKKEESDKYSKAITENVSKYELIIKEENGSTCIFDKNIFSANDYIDEFENFNFVINFSNMNESETSIILAHYKDKNLRDYIEIDNYFLLNKIGYKVGELE